MNIHEHQAKQILKKYGAVVPEGVFALNVEELLEKVKSLKTEKYVLKAQIHAGGRGKAGGVKILNTIDELELAAKELLGKTLITHQTGPEGREVKRLYVEESSNIEKEFYLSCLVDRASSKIAFISSDQGGMDIEEVASKTPEKILTTKVDINEEISNTDCEKIIKIFDLNNDSKNQAINLIKSIYKMFISTDANMVEVNPLILTKEEKIVCLDAKVNFDSNALFRHPEIVELRDLNEEDSTEIEASKHDLAYIKLDGSIGCMVNGAGLAMATMDIIKLFGQEPANFLDVGGGASKEKVSAAFKIILSDPNVKGILINIFGGIMRCDILAQGVVDAAKEISISVPLVVRLAGTNFKEGKEILDNSGLKLISAENLDDAAKKIIEAIKYNVGFKNTDESIILMWEDNRESKKLYGNVLFEGELSHFNGNQISFSDNSSTEIDLSSPTMVYASEYIYTATFDATTTPKKIRINKLNTELENVWAQTGVALTPENDQRNVFLVDLGGVGVGCFWSESRSFLSGFDIFFQSLNPDGEPQLSSGGITVAESNGDDYIQAFIPAPDGISFLIFCNSEFKLISIVFALFKLFL